MIFPPSLAKVKISLLMSTIFNDTSRLKLKEVPIALLPKPKVLNKDVLYIMSLSEKGGMVESVTIPADGDGVIISLSKNVSVNVEMIFLDNSLPFSKYFRVSFSFAACANPVIHFIPETFDSIASYK